MIPTVFTTRRPGYRSFHTPMNSNCHSYEKLPDVNIIDEQDQIEMQVAVPGIDKSKININLEDDVLTISYDADENDAKEQKFLKKEFAFGSFKRAFNLTDEIDQENVKARQENGILYITLPKKEEAKDKGPRAIDVK